MNRLPPTNIIEQQLAHIADRPVNPCLVCASWRPDCNQAACPIFQNYRQELIKFWQNNQNK